MDTFITTTCHIRNAIFKTNNGIRVKERNATLDDFIMKCFKQLQVNYPKFYKMDNLSKLGFLATEALLSARFDKVDFQPDSVALILSNAHASLDTDINYLKSMKKVASPSLFVYTLPNIVAGEICIRHGLKGENAFFITDKFDAVLMTEYVSMVMNQPGTKMCIAGWVDVLEGHYDVFLYLVEKIRAGLGLLHTHEQVKELYT